MKWIGRLMGSAAAVLLTAGNSVSATPLSASTADSAWSDAVKLDTLEAYAQFAMTYPQSKQAVLAYRKLLPAGAAAAAGDAANEAVLDHSPDSTTIDLVPVPLFLV